MEHSDFKAAFLEHEQQERINTGKVACLLVVVLMPAGVLLDWFVYREEAGYFLFLRLLCSLLALVLWGLHFTAPGQRHYRLVGLPIPLLPAFFITLMIVETNGAESPYYAGLNLILLAITVAALVATFRTNINRFSLHALYRNRLQRAWLGASTTALGTRRYERIIDFDANDNLAMVDLLRPPEMRDTRRHALFHVVNVALNTLASNRRAWQERKAAPFTISPLHCGSSLIVGPGAPGARSLGVYRPTDCYGGREGLSLATAMAISGAAASPNMGYHSSPGITFLMAMFNVRLGWWLGNPADAKTYRLHGPLCSPLAFLIEAFGLTNEHRSYVYLSDGGHFENLGLYEMVLRRVRTIVVSDASRDPTRAYEDLGNAVRKIYIDLAIRISFPDTRILGGQRDGDPTTNPTPAHAIGIIHYSELDPTLTDGIILYIRPSLEGRGLPMSVQSYARTHPDFPNESTADQWFSESQLESYRALGFHITDTLLSDALVTHYPRRTDGEAITLADLVRTLGPPASPPRL